MQKSKKYTENNMSHPKLKDSATDYTD